MYRTVYSSSSTVEILSVLLCSTLPQYSTVLDFARQVGLIGAASGRIKEELPADRGVPLVPRLRQDRLIGARKERRNTGKGGREYYTTGTGCGTAVKILPPLLSFFLFSPPPPTISPALL